MAEYSETADYRDKTFKVDDATMLEADAQVDAELAVRGIKKADITLPNSILTQLAVAIASAKTCYEKAAGEDSLLISKAVGFEKSAKALKAMLTSEALGIVPEATSTSGYGSCAIGRG
jgi:hypothetical protein